MKEKGITLIVLVVTIILIIIISAVTVNFAIKNNGLFSKTRNSVLQQENTQVVTAIQIQYSNFIYNYEYLDFYDYIKAKTIIDTNGKINIVNLLGENNQYGNGQDSDYYMIQRNPDIDKINYTISYTDKDGEKSIINVISDDNENIFDVATKDSNQSSSNNDIGIAEDFSSVNMDLWLYNEIQNNECSLGDTSNDSCGVGTKNAYIGNIVNGKIVGKMPKYIKTKGKILLVTKLYATFRDLPIVEAPEIPNSVIDASGTFYNCSKLTTVTIPNNITKLGDYTFYKCTSLLNIRIPNTVITVGRYVFCDFTSQQHINIQASTIPSTWNADWNKNCAAIISMGVQ